MTKAIETFQRAAMDGLMILMGKLIDNFSKEVGQTRRFDWWSPPWLFITGTRKFDDEEPLYNAVYRSLEFKPSVVIENVRGMATQYDGRQKQSLKNFLSWLRVMRILDSAIMVFHSTD